jgi:hypothetical protein
LAKRKCRFRGACPTPRELFEKSSTKNKMGGAKRREPFEKKVDENF